jgi:FkbM family methyltransferase
MRIARWFEKIAIETNFLFLQGNAVSAALFFCLSAACRKWPIPVIVKSRRLWIRPTTPDLSVADACFSGELSEAINATSPPEHAFIIDAGGYIGTAAIVFAEAFPDALIITLEPSNENFEILCRNIAKYPNIVPIKAALGATTGSAQLRNRGTGEWGFSIVQQPADCGSAEVLHDVRVTTIEAILSDHGSRGIDLLKLDIEGSELDLLNTRPDWINITRVIAAELHDRIAPGCTAAFQSAMEGRIQLPRNGEKVISLQRITAVTT